jgi:hypothetical protein
MTLKGAREEGTSPVVSSIILLRIQGCKPPYHSHIELLADAKTYKFAFFHEFN